MPALSAVVVALVVSGCASSTVPEASETPAVGVVVAPAPPLNADELDLYGGVARVSFAADCTATLIETGVDAAPAYLVTNGHCVGLDSAPVNRTLVDTEGFGTARFFDVAGGSDVLEVDAVRFAYGTMRGTDVAIVQVDATLGALRGAGAVPLSIADAAPEPGQEVVNIAAPTQGIDPSEQVLRKGTCTLGDRTDVIEFQWLWLDAIANDCPGVLGGSSGSPLIAEGEVVSIINTTNTGVPEGRGDTCYLGKPCQVRGAEAVFVAEKSYGVDITGVGSCFVDGTFALGEGCPLSIAELWDVDGGGIFGPNGEDGGGFTPSLDLRSAVSGDARIITGLSLGDARSCSDPVAYDGAASVALAADADEPVIVAVELPHVNGFVLACAAMVGHEDQPARFVFAVDAIAPTAGPVIQVEDLGDARMIDPLFDIPDIADIRYLVGPEGDTNCADLEAYSPYRRQSIFVDDDELPATFCAIGYDMAGNASPITERVIR